MWYNFFSGDNMKLITKEEMKRIDNNTCKKVGSYNLVKIVGTKMANIILKKYNPKKVLLVLGSGGNASDAFVIGNILNENNVLTYAYLNYELKNVDAIKLKEEYKGLYTTNIDNLQEFDLIVDAIYGIGLNRELDSKTIDLINKLNDSNKPIVSLDIPSGIDALSGISYGAFIKADLTITIEYIKTGMYLQDGLDSTNKIKVIKVGMDKTNNLIELVELKDFKDIYPKRNRNSNKGNYHKSSLIAGSIDYLGASLISYNALLSFKMGLGYESLYVPKSCYSIYQLRHPELIVKTINDKEGYIDFDSNTLDTIIKNSNSIAIGMGLGISIEVYKTIEYLLKNFNGKLLIDADGLNTLSKYGIDILKNKKCDVILTPHIKEFEQLTNIKKEEIIKNPIDYALDFAKKYNITLMLKSASTIITNGYDIAINHSGNSSLAKAGSGDALSGITAGLLAYIDKDSYTIAKMSSFILGTSAEYASIKTVEECITIEDIIKYVPKVIKSIKELNKN